MRIGGTIATNQNKKICTKKLDSKQLRIVKPFWINPYVYRLTEKKKLIRYLAGLEKKLLVECDKSILNAKQSLQKQRCFLRLTPFKEKGMKIDLLVSPTSTKTYFVPASGPESVLEQDAEGNAYRTVAEGLLRGTLSSRAHYVDTFSYEIPF